MNKISSEDDWIDRGQTEGAQKLHTSIQSVLPLLESAEFDPIVLGQAYMPSRWRNQQPEIQFHFQYGPRYWTEYGLYQHEKSPAYQNLLKRALKQLDEEKWYELVEDLYDQTINYRHTSGTRQFRCFLSKQGDDVWLVGNDQSTSCFVAYEVSDKGMELLGRPDSTVIRYLSYAPREPVVPHEMKATDKRKITFVELQSEVNWRFRSKLDDTIDSLLAEAYRKLHPLGNEVALLWSKSRFNDAHQDENWTAIRVGGYFWQSGSYFTNDAKSLASAPENAHIAQGILHQLISSNISHQYMQCYGLEVHALDVCGLYVQNGEFYFAISSSNGDDGPTYQIDTETGNLSFIGSAKRLDETIYPTNSTMVDGKLTHTPQKALQWVSIETMYEMIGQENIPYEDWIELRYFNLSNLTK